MKLKRYNPIENYKKRVHIMCDKLNALNAYLTAAIDNISLYDYAIHVHSLDTGEVCIITQTDAKAPFILTEIEI